MWQSCVELKHYSVAYFTHSKSFERGNTIEICNRILNIGTYFDYNNHIVFISTHTKIGTPYKKAPLPHKWSDLAFQM